MRPIRLRLKGFRGIRAGMGQEEFTLELGAVPTGLIAITGENGSGKTTILDNLHPYRLMPFKVDDTYSPGAFSYYDQTFGKAEKELVWEHEGVLYRSLLLIDADKRKQEAFLFATTDGEYVPYNEDCATGKNRFYDDAVASILGTPDLFFTGPFRAQGAKRLSDYPRAEVMGLVTEILGLSAIEADGEKAKQVHKGIKVKVDVWREEQTRLSGAEAERQSLLDEAVGHDKTVVASKEAVAKFNERDGELRTELHAIEGKKSLILEAEEALKSAREDLSGAENRLSAAVEEEVTQKQGYVAYTANVAESRRSQETRKLEAEAILGRADEIKAAAEKVPLFEETVEAKEKFLAEEQAKGEAAKALFDENEKDLLAIDGIKNDKSHAEKERESVTLNYGERIAALEQSVENLTGLDCRGDDSGWVNEKCRFVSDAAKAKNEGIPALAKERDDKLKEIDERLSEIEERFNVEMGKVADREKELGKTPREHLEACRSDYRLAQTGLESAKKLLEEKKALAAEAPKLEAAESTIADADAVLKRLDEEADTRQKEHEAALAAIAKRTEEAKADKERCSERVAKAQADSPVGLVEREKEVRSELEINEKAAKTAQDLLDDAKEKAATLRGEANALASAEDRLFELRCLITSASEHLAAWNTIIKGHSSKGIIALEIDDAGPGISAITNDLLRACYGDRFTVSILTQVEKKDGSGVKEVFDIMVSDSKTGETVSIREKSGGEASYVEDAITRALCLHTIEASGKVFESVFSDEQDGALDAEKKRHFVTIKRKAMERGGHSREFFISQTPELVAMADARIVLDSAGATVDT